MQYLPKITNHIEYKNIQSPTPTPNPTLPTLGLGQPQIKYFKKGEVLNKPEINKLNNGVC